MQWKSSLHVIVSILVVLAAGCGVVNVDLAARADPSPTTVARSSVEDIVQAVTKVIQDPGVVDYAVCNLRPGLWAEKEYSVRVDIAKFGTQDNMSRTFTVTDGVFREITAEYDSRTLATSTRNGNLGVSDKALAFSRGMPYFIRDVVVDNPQVIRYVVETNSDVAVHQLDQMGLLAIVQSRGSAQGSTVTKSTYDRAVRSHLQKASGTTQELSFTTKIAEPLDTSLTTHLSLQSESSGGSSANYCLMSNEAPIVAP